MHIDAIFLALDDVIFDTAALHLAACNEAFANAGLAARWDLAQLRGAVRARGHQLAIGEVLGADEGAQHKARVASLVADKQRLFHEAVVRQRPAPHPACRHLIDDAVQAGCKLAILTDMPAATSAVLLEQCFGNDVNSMFSVVAAGVDFQQPAAVGAYGTALRAMGVEALASIALGVASPGLRAATGADVLTVSVTPFEHAAGGQSTGELWRPQLDELRHMLGGRRLPAERRRQLFGIDVLQPRAADGINRGLR